MSKILFEEENDTTFKSRALFGKPVTPTMVRLLLKSGIVKNEKQAISILLVSSIVFLLVGIFLITTQPGGNKDNVKYVEDLPDFIRSNPEILKRDFPNLPSRNK